MATDPFALLKLPRRLDLDDQTLRSAFLRACAAVHPDRVSHDSVAQAQAEEQAAAINEAHAVLADPALRADALLRLMGGASAEQDKTLEPDLLEQMMDIREKLETARARDDQAAVAEVTQWAHQQERDRFAKIRHAFEQAEDLAHRSEALREVRLQLNALQYIRRTLEALGQG